MGTALRTIITVFPIPFLHISIIYFTPFILVIPCTSATYEINSQVVKLRQFYFSLSVACILYNVYISYQILFYLCYGRQIE